MASASSASPPMTASATSQDALHALLREVLPPQGGWSDEGYLWLTDRCNRLVEKRADYAEAGIPEYWIVDPRDETVTVLALEGDAYVGHGVFAAGDSAASRLPGGIRRGRDGGIRRSEGRGLNTAACQSSGSVAGSARAIRSGTRPPPGAH